MEAGGGAVFMASPGKCSCVSSAGIEAGDGAVFMASPASLFLRPSSLSRKPIVAPVLRGRTGDYPSIREWGQKMPDSASPKAYRIRQKRDPGRLPRKVCVLP